MTVEDTEITLAPLDKLRAILPEVEKAKERDRLGTALQKATISAQNYDWIPSRLQDVSTLLEAIAPDNNELRTELVPLLSAIINMARVLAGEPSIEQLDNVNQSGMVQLPLHIEKIVDRIETVWRRCVRQDLGGHAALGAILSAIPGVRTLGGDLTRLAEQARSLENPARRAADRVAQRDALVVEASGLANRLREAGVEPPVAKFLVAVAAHPVRLTDLTEDVFAWLKNHDALSLFSVSALGA